MANELKHGDQGCSLTKAEFEGVGLHVFNSQSTGDIGYASSSSQLSRLGIGSSNALLEVASGIPGWTTSPTIGATSWANANHAHAACNSGGPIAITATTGTLAVGSGGTGATTFTDGGVLLGSGSGAITALAVLTDGQMIVGDGSGDPVAESGATLRTSIGVGTGDTLSISGLTLSTDLSVANGGTGASSLTSNGVLIGNGTAAVSAVDMSTKGHVLIGDGSGNPQMLAVGCNAQVLTACSGETTGVKWAAAAGGPAQATQAAVEAETNEDTYIPPDLIKNSPGVAKAWCGVDSDGSELSSYNISATSTSATGKYTVTLDTDMSNTAYVVVVVPFEGHDTSNPRDSKCQALATGSYGIRTFTEGTSLVNVATLSAAFGDQ
jgi:hypothetical protein